MIPNRKLRIYEYRLISVILHTGSDEENGLLWQYALQLWHIASKRGCHMTVQFNPTLSGKTDVLVQAQHKLNDWFNWDINSDLDYSILAKEGVNPNVVNQLLEHGFVKAEIAWIIPPRTLSHRIQNNEPLSRDESAKAIRAARICAIADSVFGNSNKAQRWLSKPKKHLSGLSPKEVIQDEFGARMIESMLMKIDEGFF